jgi:hypothetical protein
MKRRDVLEELSRPGSELLSEREIARRVGVSHAMVSRLRAHTSSGVQSLYVIMPVVGDSIKVGMSMDASDRLRQHQLNSPVRLTLVCHLDVVGFNHGQMRRVEKRVHAMLEGHHLWGEWFRDCPDSRAALDRYLGLVSDDFAGHPSVSVTWTNAADHWSIPSSETRPVTPVTHPPIPNGGHISEESGPPATDSDGLEYGRDVR